MKVYDISDIRNVGLIGHGSSGKTSLAAALLFSSGAVNRLGKVDQGTTITDHDAGPGLDVDRDPAPGREHREAVDHAARDLGEVGPTGAAVEPGDVGAPEAHPPHLHAVQETGAVVARGYDPPDRAQCGLDPHQVLPGRIEDRPFVSERVGAVADPHDPPAAYRAT